MIKVQRIHPDAKLPVCAHPGEDLCFDLSSVEALLLQPGVPTLVATGIKIEMPEGWGAVIRPRSGMSKLGILVGGGEIDNGYRGEIFVMLTLLPTRSSMGYSIKKGDRIAQIRPQQILTMLFDIVEVFDELSDTTRGENGFGSTGR
jgi:dUTP pyrophosphatase